jgi:hypothetical protein
MRETLFKEKISKFGSLLSLIVITSMLALFSLALPGFLISTTGRMFAVLWAVLAIGVFIAHIHNFTPDRRRQMLPYLAEHKRDVRLSKQEKKYLRG